MGGLQGLRARHRSSFPNQAEELIEKIRKTTDKPIRYVSTPTIMATTQMGTEVSRRRRNGHRHRETAGQLFRDKGSRGVRSVEEIEA